LLKLDFFFYNDFFLFIRCFKIFSSNLLDALLWSFSSTTLRRDYYVRTFLISVWFWFRCEVFSWNRLFNCVLNASLYESRKKFHLFCVVQRRRFDKKTQVMAQLIDVDAFSCFFSFDWRRFHFQRENNRDWYLIWKLIEIETRFAFDQIVS
jgi:hypothetical protein